MIVEMKPRLGRDSTDREETQGMGIGVKGRYTDGIRIQKTEKFDNKYTGIESRGEFSKTVMESEMHAQ